MFDRRWHRVHLHDGLLCVSVPMRVVVSGTSGWRSFARILTTWI